MKFKSIFFVSLAFIFGFGSFWNLDRGIELASQYIQGNTTQTASVMLVSESLINNAGGVQVSPKTIGSTEQKLIIKNPNEIIVMVGGDMMLDRNVRLLAEKSGYDSLFTNITPLWNDADIVAVNLEGPITSSSSKTLLANKTLTKSFSFTFDPITVDAMSKAHISVVSLANNHTDNFGIKGFEETKKYLSQGGIQWFGNPWNTKSIDTVISKNGGNVAFVGYHAFQTGFVNVVARVKELSKQGNFVIVMPHWGNEYIATSTAKMKSQARELVSAGANAIIGSHSHVIGENEWVGTVPVYYSLGNLLFDQYFSPETMQGELVELHLMVRDGKTIFDSLQVIPVSNASRKGIDLVNTI